MLIAKVSSALWHVVRQGWRQYTIRLGVVNETVVVEIFPSYYMLLSWNGL